MYEDGYPEIVFEVARKCVAKHPDDITKSKDICMREIAKLDEFEDLQAKLMRTACNSFIDDVRHAENRRIKNDAKIYGGPGKVVVGKSKEALEAANRVLKMTVASYLLIAMTKTDLKSAIDFERTQSNGHLANIDLCQNLLKIVPEGKTVGQAVKKDQLWKMVRKSQAKYKGQGKLLVTN